MDTLPATCHLEVGLSAQNKARVLKSQFGDGYSQRSRDGINNIGTTLNPSWDRVPAAEKDVLIEFLEAKGGAEAFLFTLPKENIAKKYRCEEWNVDPLHTGKFKITATFERVFDHD